MNSASRVVGEKTLQDIMEIPKSIDAVRENFDSLKEVTTSIVNRNCRCLYFTGCGSSYYSAMLISIPLQIHRPKLNVRVLPSSEILMYLINTLSEECCIVAISRSGETAETLEVMKRGRERGTYNVIITISEKSESIKYADEYLYINVGVERGIVMTKSFYSMSLAGLVITLNMVAGKSSNMDSELDKLKEHAISMIEKRSAIFRLAENYINMGINRFVVLGSGPSYPIALEASLKLKEASYVAAEAMHALEFRHGPIATLDKNVLVVIINQDGKSYSYVYKLYEELRNIGANVLRLSNKDLDEDTLPLSRTSYEELDALSAILLLQLITYGYTVASGLDIDSPRRLVRVVTRY